jgi:hypothetical protein
MAVARHDRHPDPQHPDPGHSQPVAVELREKSEHKRTPISNRIKWILAGIMLGAAAGWMVFQAFLTLITLD